MTFRATSFTLAAIILLALIFSELFISHSQNIGSGWRMAGFNPQKTNTSSVAGPSTMPTFQVIATNIRGSLKRIGDDGSFYLADGIFINSYSYSGEFRWSARALGQVEDIALGPDGTVYASTYTTVEAFNKDTGQATWPSPYIASTNGNESSGMTIESDGTIFFNTGASYVGGDSRLVAINPDGTKKWDRSPSGRGYQKVVLNNDETVLYFGYTTGFSTATGEVVFNDPPCLAGDIALYTPWNTLITGEHSSRLNSLSPNLQTCRIIETHGWVWGPLALTRAGNFVLSMFDNTLSAIDREGKQLWKTTEHLAGLGRTHL